MPTLLRSDSTSSTLYKTGDEAGLDPSIDGESDRLMLATPISNGTLKRKLPIVDDQVFDSVGDAVSLEDETEVARSSARPQKRQRLAHIAVPSLAGPKSGYEGWQPPMPEASERLVLREFLDALDSAGNGNAKFGDEEFICFDLSNFSIYKPGGTKNEYDFVSLQDLFAKDGQNCFCFDGVLQSKNQQRYIQEAPFQLVSIGNYTDLDEHTVGNSIWIQSVQGKAQGVWYKLLNPSPEYGRFHDSFVWLANFAKHFVDYLDEKDYVTLHDFKSDFNDLIMTHHGQDHGFQTWYQQYGDSDFRKMVAAHPDFLWKEAIDLDQTNSEHPIWTEMHPKYLTAVKEQPIHEHNTIVTSFVYNCFKNMEFGKFLKVVEPAPGIHISRLNREEALSLTVDSLSTMDSDAEQVGTSSLPGQGRIERLRSGTKIIVGDVIAIKPDSSDFTQWSSTSDLWYGYVQHISHSHSGKRLLKVIWLYRPSDTTCSTMRYPIPNELFFSDNCNCTDAPLDAATVVGKAYVEFFGCPGTRDYFVRQKYLCDEASFVTLQDSDFHCVHHAATKPVDHTFDPGDTLLVKHKPDVLEVVELIRYENDHRNAVVRLLVSRRTVYEQGDAAPNELVYTEDFRVIKSIDIFRKCHVRFYSASDRTKGKIPPPYNRHGTGDAFYIIYRANDKGELENITSPGSLRLKQGFDPQHPSPSPKLRGLDLFCGGGTFGRGLEEGGAIENKWAVDWAKHAMHTYRANLQCLSDTELYYGSVNDFLMQVMKGQHSDVLPTYGEVDFISAGSPCQGFSNANQRAKNDVSLRNCSMVASVAAFVDFFRPKYAILENVTSMANKGPKDSNVFSQMLCTLVGLGYQVQQFNLDAWSFGSPQSRSRLFISIAAPGLPLPSHPALTHSHPPGTTDRALGKAANGLGFGLRRHDPTPFSYITALEATKDLPNIGNAQVSACISFPDHRPSRFESELTRSRISSIPVYPRRQSFVKAASAGYMSDRQLRAFCWDNKHRSKPNSRSWSRLHPLGLFPTVTTSIQPACAFTGSALHWDQHRVLTVMEARRAQSFPDHEVLIGNAAQQWKIVGNSVARTVALALGMSLRESWLAEKSVKPLLPVAEKLSKPTSVRGDAAKLPRAPVNNTGYMSPATEPSIMTSISRSESEDPNLQDTSSDLRHMPVSNPGSIKESRKRKRASDEDSSTQVSNTSQKVEKVRKSDKSAGSLLRWRAPMTPESINKGSNLAAPNRNSTRTRTSGSSSHARLGIHNNETVIIISDDGDEPSRRLTASIPPEKPISDAGGVSLEVDADLEITRKRSLEPPTTSGAVLNVSHLLDGRLEQFPLAIGIQPG